MRLISNKESSRNGEPSLLAIFETLAAMSLSVWYGVHFETWWHVFIGAAIAPLMLLRIDESCRHGIDLYFVGVDRLNIYMNAFPTQVSASWIGRRLPLLASIVAVVGISIIGFFGVMTIVIMSRIIATMRFFFTDFTAMKSAIPRNFWRITVASDVFTSPELMPVPDELLTREELYPGFEVYQFVPSFHDAIVLQLLPAMRQHKSVIGRCFVCFLYFAITLAAAVCFVYRGSVKMSAIIWLPLLWALKPVKQKGRSWRRQLLIDWQLKKPQFIAIMSGVCLCLLAMKYILWAGRFELVIHIDSLRSMLEASQWSIAPGLVEWLIAVVRPGAIPLWQVATGLNSVLGIYLWWQFRKWVVEFQHDLGPSDQSIARMLGVTFVFRRLFTFYASICNLYIAYSVAKLLPVPQIGLELFPWL